MQSPPAAAAVGHFLLAAADYGGPSGSYPAVRPGATGTRRLPGERTPGIGKDDHESEAAPGERQIGAI